MGYQTTLLDDLRRFDVPVIEMDGWRTRGKATITPRVGVNHHTVSRAIGPVPSLGVVTNGRPGLPGPLCNVLGGRDHVARLVAAGRSNNAGEGSWKGITGNSNTLALEMEHTGLIATEEVTEEDIDFMARIQAAFAWNRYGADMVCLTADALVLTRRGLVQIDRLVVGDEVWTHRHRWRPVTAVQSKVDRVVRLRGQGHPGLLATADHPIRSYRTSRGRVPGKNRSANNLRVHEQEWVDAGDMAGRLWLSPRIRSLDVLPDGCPVEVSPELMAFVGRWLGDGHIASGSFHIAAGPGEADAVEALFRAVGLPAHRRQIGENCDSVSGGHAQLVEWVAAEFDKGAANKTLPAWVFDLPEKHRDALLGGYLAADGHLAPDGRWQANTVSKALAIGVKLLAQSLGWTCNLHRHEPKPTTVIAGRTVSQRPYWQLRLTPEFVNERTTAIERDGFILSTCKTVDDVGLSVPVYDITVEEDHSFMADGIIVSNCQHYEWAPNRKIDFVKSAVPDIYTPDSFRRRVEDYLRRGGAKPTKPPAPKPPTEDEEIMGAKDDILKEIEGSKPHAFRASKNFTRPDGQKIKGGQVYVVGAFGMYPVNRNTLNGLYFSGDIRRDKAGQPQVVDPIHFEDVPMIRGTVAP